MSSSAARSRAYYDEFSETYEKHRHRGYHALIDDLELELAEPYCRGAARVLEAGCGTGLILRRLEAVTDGMVVGIDLSAGMLSVACTRGLAALQSSVEALPFSDASFDTVVSFKVLAHVPEIRPALAELARVTRPGGHLLLEFYNRASLRTLIKQLKQPTRIGRRFSDEDVYTRFDTLGEIRAYLPADVDLVDIRGIRVVTPFAQLHDLPLVRSALSAAERFLGRAPLFRNLGGFLVVVLRKR